MIIVLKGGWSAEREVSLASGKICAQALRDCGHDVQELDARESVVTDLPHFSPEIVFNALHGGWGENGTVQGLLESLSIPYTHSGVLASALAMNKEKAKKIFVSAGIPVIRSVSFKQNLFLGNGTIKKPIVIKPNNGGSSIGVSFFEPDCDPKQIDMLFAKYRNTSDDLIVEEYIPGRELTTAIIDGKAVAVTEIISDSWFSYDAKYLAGGSKHITPAKIPGEIYDACLSYALKAHDALGCRGISRIDFRWDYSKGLDGLFVLEINTQPGMTLTSLLPEQAAKVGLTMSALCEWILKDASCCR